MQLDGAGAKDLCDQIEGMGADVVRVPVYRWSLPADSTDAERLIRAVVDRRVDALTFTAKPAVENFLEIAGFMNLLDDVTEALQSGDVRVFCVGPVCATGVTEAGLPDPFVPVRHRLGAMVQQVAQYFATQGEDVQMAGTPVRVQGRLALIDGGQAAWLTDRERALLAALLDRQGAVLSKPELLRRVWRGAETDEHLVEVTVARLRQRLGPASDGIETVVRRGYRVERGVRRRRALARHPAFRFAERTAGRGACEPAHDHRSHDCGGVHDPFTASSSRGNGDGVRSTP